MIGRLVIAIIGAIAVTFGLLFTMQLLIATGRSADEDQVKGRIVDFVRVKRDENVETKKPKPKKPPPPEAPPPDAPKPKLDNVTADSGTINIAPVDVNADVNINAAFGFSAVDGDYLPIVKVAPVYPRRAADRGIEGYVILEFTVTKTGTVQNPVVVEADPPNYFERAAIQAAQKFKYKPRVVDGVAIDTPGVQNIIRFELEG